MKKGYIHIYTGDGKGKTTAAVGLAARAKSQGFRVLFVQFFKEHRQSGEIRLLENAGIETMIFKDVRSPLFNPSLNKNKLRKKTEDAMEMLKKVLDKDEFDLMVLDEFNCLIYEGLLSEDEAAAFIRNKPERLELVLTGRGAPERTIEIADYVTVMQKVKHPYRDNIKGRKGIEF
ncbi:MAG: cob(I)yrinic acid a,c-diamide adenosyltransferase [Nitrospiraceae bacterium]|jgi:cob(I)alamin adenosyltransferase|nr:MAG: cob(I)yrinic acid a,c-diamide adenosyltransferase [Nitrospiraceae bacterium]